MKIAHVNEQRAADHAHELALLDRQIELQRLQNIAKGHLNN